MKKQIFVIPILVLSTWISSLANADKANPMDGVWELDPTAFIRCTSSDSASPWAVTEYLNKYKGMQLSINGLTGAYYWITEYGEHVAVPFDLTATDSPNKFIIKRPGTTIADVELILLYKKKEIEFRSKDTEWNMCLPAQFRAKYKYLGPRF